MTFKKAIITFIIVLILSLVLANTVNFSKFFNVSSEENTTNLCVGWYFEEQNRTIELVELLTECEKPECDFKIDGTTQLLNVKVYNTTFCDMFDINCEYFILNEYYPCNTVVKTTKIKPYGDVFYSKKQ